MLGVGAQYSGPITTLTSSTDESVQSLNRFSVDGKLSWSQADSHPLNSLTVEANSGNLYVWGQTGHGPFFTGADLYELSPDGSGEQLLDSCGGECWRPLLAADSQGDRVVVHGMPEVADAVVTLTNGTTWTLKYDDGFVIFAAAFDPDGNVVVVGASKAMSYQGQALVQGALVMKFDRSGHVLWVQQLPGSGSFHAVGTSAKGTVVALGTSDASSWGGQSFPAGLVLVTAESNGTPRWVRSVKGSDQRQMYLAVDPAGQAALAVAAGCAGTTVAKYNLAGDFLWARTFASSECDSNHPVTVAGVAISNHDVVVAGEYAGSVDFGTGTQKAQNSQGSFVLKLSQ